MTNKVRHGKRLYKQMSLEVAVRNPERYEGILKTLEKFENFILDDNRILDVYSHLYLDEVVTADSLKDVTLTIATKVSATGTLFGSVSNIQIAEELAKLGHNVDRKIIFVKGVKEVGSYTATVKLHKEVSVEIPFEVVAEAE